ncbi:MAG: hypothetical protein QM765_37525 [Myxococcales bacterium]
MRIKFGDEGRVQDLAAVEDTTGSARLGACVLTQLRHVVPVPEMRNEAVRYPFVFSPTRTAAIPPFVNLVGDQASDWLRTALSETLSAKLGQLSKIVLVDRAQLERELAKPGPGDRRMDAARAARARVVVLGGFQCQGEQLRLTAQLVSTSDGRSRATVEVTGATKDLFALEDELAQKLVDALNLEKAETAEALSIRTGNSLAVLKLLGAANNALSGVGEPANPRKAEVLLRQLVAMAPDIPEAHYGLARASWTRGQDVECDRRARDELQMALKQRPGYYEALTALGFYLWHAELYEEAFEVQQRAVRLKPEYGEGYFGLGVGYAAFGKGEEAIAMVQRAVELEPLDDEFETQLGFLLALYRHDLEGALRHTRAATEMKTAGGWAFGVHGFVQLLAGDAQGCIQSLAEGGKKREPVPAVREQMLACEAACRAAAGDLVGAREAYGRLSDESRRQIERGTSAKAPHLVALVTKHVREKLAPILPEVAASQREGANVAPYSDKP